VYNPPPPRRSRPPRSACPVEHKPRRLAPRDLSVVAVRWMEGRSSTGHSHYRQPCSWCYASSGSIQAVGLPFETKRNSVTNSSRVAIYLRFSRFVPSSDVAQPARAAYSGCCHERRHVHRLRHRTERLQRGLLFRMVSAAAQGGGRKTAAVGEQTRGHGSPQFQVNHGRVCA
jgi:hypothetical protein